MDPPLRSQTADGYDCIMVPNRDEIEYKAVTREVSRGERLPRNVLKLRKRLALKNALDKLNPIQG